MFKPNISNRCLYYNFQLFYCNAQNPDKYFLKLSVIILFLFNI